MSLEFSVLAQTAERTADKAAQSIVWFAILLAIILLASVVVLFIRRRMLGEPKVASDPFGLQEIESLRSAGTISQEEYESLRRHAVAALTGRGGAAEATAREAVAEPDAGDGREGEQKPAGEEENGDGGSSSAPT